MVAISELTAKVDEDQINWNIMMLLLIARSVTKSVCCLQAYIIAHDELSDVHEAVSSRTRQDSKIEQNS